MTDDVPRLACGRPVDEVWETIDRPMDAHESSCPDCQSARSSLAALQSATDDLRVADEADESLRPSTAIKTNVMAIARAEISRSRRLPMTVTEPGDGNPQLSISEHAIAAVVRRAADELPQVRSRRCRITVAQADETTIESDRFTPDAGTAPAVDPVPIAIQLRVAVRADAAIMEIQEQVRRRVGRTVAAEIGLPIHRVDIVVEDVFDE